MKINEATIQITRKEGKLRSVSVFMPIWEKIGHDNSLTINLPLFGIKSFADKDVDIQLITEDTIKAFCINSEKFGLGLEAELIALGWTEQGLGVMVYTISDNNIVVEQLMETGERHMHSLELQESYC